MKKFLLTILTLSLGACGIQSENTVQIQSTQELKKQSFFKSSGNIYDYSIVVYAALDDSRITNIESVTLNGNPLTSGDVSHSLLDTQDINGIVNLFAPPTATVDQLNSLNNKAWIVEVSPASIASGGNSVEIAARMSDGKILYIKDSLSISNTVYR